MSRIACADQAACQAALREIEPIVTGIVVVALLGAFVWQLYRLRRGAHVGE